jgi:hypothetical protein
LSSYSFILGPLSNMAGLSLVVPPLLEEGGLERSAVEQKSGGPPGAMVVVVVALGMIGVLGAVLGNAANDRTVAKERTTLTVVTKTREARVVDLGPQGPTQGDMRVVNAPLYDENLRSTISSGVYTT